MTSEDVLKAKYRLMAPLLDERSYRLYRAAEAMSLGGGGVSGVAQAAGVSRTTLYAGIRELGVGRAQPQAGALRARSRARHPGAGRKRQAQREETLLADLDRLLDPVTRGDPRSPLRWTCKSTAKLAAELCAMGHQVSQATGWRRREQLGYSMQSNRKTPEGAAHPDRHAQCELLSATVQEFLQRGLPVISVDTQKKE